MGTILEGKQRAVLEERNSADITRITDSSGGTASDTIAAMTNTAALTDSSTGTATNTLATCSGLSTSDTYTDAAVNAKLDIVDNSVASLAEELGVQRTLNTALINAVASLAAKIDDIQDALDTAKITA